MKVLFCTDGSDISFNALENYMNIARNDMVIDVISVIDWSFLPDDVIIEDSCFTSTCRNMADDILAKSKSKIEERGFIVGELIKHCGNVVECILDQLSATTYDIVIVGSHGKKGLQRWLGSVSKFILEEGETSTYISTRSQCCKKILFIADEGEASIESVKNSINLLNIKDCEIHICSVIESPDLLFLDGTLDPNWINTIRSQQYSSSQASIYKLKQVFEDLDIQISKSEILSGIPAKSLLEYVKEKEINLIVTGVKSRSKMHKFLLDSVSKRVLENTSSDMFVNFML